jgi:ferredoxin
MKIVPELCTSCGDCELECPTASIKPKKGVYVINAETCKKCEDEFDSPKCVELCPIDDCILAIAA